MKLYLVNGFLGSGKTTAIQMASQLLIDNNRKVAVVTNDQGEELVDTAFLKSHRLSTLEVTGGCFCCHYEKLSAAINDLEETERPEIIFAESVGSCTDLIATVAKPLNRFYPGMEIVISVFTDSRLLLALMTNNASFVSEEVQYVYKQQISEADLLIINKIDLLNEDELASIKRIIQEDYKEKLVLYQHSNDPTHINIWLQMLDTFPQPQARNSIEIDYDLYAKGEAMLAWLDQSLSISTSDDSALTVATDLVTDIFDRIKRSGYLIGHLKYMIDDGSKQFKLSFTSADDKIESLTIPLNSNSNKINLLINARIQSRPQELSGIVQQALNGVLAGDRCSIIVKKLSSFQPGYPRPTYRIAN